MASLEQSLNPEPRDATFRNYSSQQAAYYAQGRPGYSETLIDFIVKQHTEGNGQTGAVLDVGCGPGSATRMLAPHFDRAYGADPGESMLDTAQKLGGAARNGTPIVYNLSAAEEIDKIDGIAHGSLDMITAATAAHWFEMPKFWAAAANLLKPGGTVAIWTVFQKDDLPGSSSELQSIFDDFRHNVLAPYTTASSHLTQTGYVDLVMPWDDPVTTPLYSRETFVRHELSGEKGFVSVDAGTKESRASAAPQNSEDQLRKLEKLAGSLGGVSRWQQANPELVGTEQDCVKVFVNKIRHALEQEGETLDLSALGSRMHVALLMVRRK